MTGSIAIFEQSSPDLIVDFRGSPGFDAYVQRLNADASDELAYHGLSARRTARTGRKPPAPEALTLP
jgi:hypothetical protein